MIDEILNKIVDKPAGFQSIGRTFDFKAIAQQGDTSSEIKAFGKPLMLEIALDAADLKGVADPAKLGVFRINDDKHPAFVGGKFDGTTKKIRFKLTGFSRYTVAVVNRTFADVASHWSKAPSASRERHPGGGGGDDGETVPEVVSRTTTGPPEGVNASGGPF